MTDATSPEWQPIIGAGPVLLDRAGAIGRITMNRPEASNGMSVEFLRALYDAVMAAHGDSDLRVVILRGAGAHFCAGGDIKAFAAKGAALPDYLREATSWLQAVAGALIRLGPSVIASVQGFAAGGGGFGLVCAADFVVAGEGARFLTAATRAGMAPDAGSSVTLQRIVGIRKAMELFLLNPVLTATEARDLGIVSRVVADDALEGETMALARQLASGAPKALAATKRLLWNAAAVEAALPEESRTVSELAGSADAREGLAAVIERRSPVFKGT